MHHKAVRIVKLILLITVLSFAVVNVVEAKMYVENFYQVGGVDVTETSPFPKGWKRSGELWADDDSDWENPSDFGYSYAGGMGSSYTPSDIDAVRVLDGIYSQSSTTANGGPFDDDAKYAVQEFMFSVAITATHLEINAYVRDEDDGIQAYIWNFATNSWELYADYSGTDIDPMWINFSTNSPSSYISASGEVYVLFQSQAYDNALFRSDTANVDIDYIEVVAEVPDSHVKTVCVDVIPGTLTGISRNWDGVFDDDTVGVQVRVLSEGSPVANYPVFIKGEWSDGYGTFGGSFTDGSGRANLRGAPVSGGVSDKWRVKFKAAVSDAMANGNAYQAGNCGEETFAENIAVTPGSYDITLVGRYWDVGGGDWVRIRWIAEPEDVSHVNIGGYNIPVAQHFDNWDFLLWKMGVVDPNNDNDGETEGVNGNTNDMNSTAYPACVGPDDSPYCPKMDSCRNGRDINVLLIGHIGSYPDGCCIRERDGAVDAHDCGTYMSGYRFGPLLQFNLPDHALGEPGKSAMFICQEYNTLSGMLRTTSYSGHEGCGGENCRLHCTACLWSIINIGQSPGATEYLAMEGYEYLGTEIIRPWPNGGLGTLSFIGLAADNEHVVGLVIGHRWGIHPFTALVTSMPSGTYPADDDVDGWQNFYPTWIYYLLRNLAYNIKVMGEELWHWKDRYPQSGEDNIILANRAFNKFLLDFIPYLDETLWILQASGNNTIHPFIVSMFTQLYDNARIVKYIVTNSTLRSEFANTVGTALTYLPNITGPVDGSTSLNYFLKYRVQMPYDEKESVNYQLMKLLDQITSFVVTILHHVPIMEYVPNSPGWSFGNWISDY